MMMGGEPELCGFIDAKLVNGRNMSQRVKKRGLAAPWKSWGRHWCSVRRLGLGRGIEVLLDHGYGSNHTNNKDSCIQVPVNAMVCRTESRTKPFAFGIFPARDSKPLVYLAASSESDSQEWMANIRQMLKPRRHRFVSGSYKISMVDNAHSRAANLDGLHGDMVACRSGIFVKDVNSGEIVETFDWKEINGAHLYTYGSVEDVKRICVVHTTKEFRAGVGELLIFCLDAPKLLTDLVTEGRGPRHRMQGHLIQRPLSLSDGDLRIPIEQEETCSHGIQPSRHKTAANIISAGLNMLVATRSGSEAKLLNQIAIGNRGTFKKMPSKKSSKNSKSSLMYGRAVDNVYQPEPASMSSVSASLEELDRVSLRRISGVSIASGIYEEILDDFNSTRTRKVPSHLYENVEDLVLNTSLKLQPPPLPPRQRCGSSSTQTGSLSDDGLDSEGGTRSATPSTQEDATPTPEDKISGPSSISADLSDYVPMSPRLQDIALLQELQKQAQQENMYMVMR